MVFLPDSENMPWTEEHDQLLRTQVSKLKGQRMFIQNTVVNLESPFNLDENVNSSKSDLDSTKAHSDSCCKSVDIESAILMQEMMSMREDLSTAKHRASQSEKEKKAACEKLKSMQTALFQLQSQLSEFGNGSSIKDRLSYSESAAAEYNASLERELLEALSRECRLKNRLQGLVTSLEVASKASLNPSTKHNVDLK
jgi:septal ring factor EnvC (AmiA/AmiB activator)